jgi:hypothetical protein
MRVILQKKIQQLATLIKQLYAKMTFENEQREHIFKCVKV